MQRIGRNIILGVLGTGYISARLGFLGTNEIVLKDSGSDVEGVQYIDITNQNFITHHSYSCWIDDWVCDDCSKHKSYSIRPTRIIHYNDKGIKTEYE